jgi:hypothetical protein
VRQCAAVCGSVRQCAAVCGSVRQCAAVCESVNSKEEPAKNLIRAYKQVELRLAFKCIKADGCQAKSVHTELDPVCFRASFGYSDSNVKERGTRNRPR